MRAYRKPGAVTLAAAAAGPGTMRRLKWNEVPRPGDYVDNGQGFEPWEGPSGFQAGSFVKPIYRPVKGAVEPLPEAGIAFIELP